MKFKLLESFNNELDIKDDIELVTDILNISRDELSLDMGMSISRFNECIQNPDKQFFNDFYDYCYNHDIYINDIKWQIYKELYTNYDTKILLHGSRSGIVGNIRLDVSGDSNDFGSGFYCGETLEQAGMFVSDNTDSCLYIIKFKSKGLNYVRFKVDTDWMLAVAYYRDTLGNYIDSNRVKKIIDKVNKADYVIAPIADNKMFQIIDEFTSGNITDKQCQYALAATHLGYQYVFKKERTLDNITILEKLFLCPVEKSFYNKEAIRETNTSINKSIIAKKKYSNVGRYIYEIL